MWKIVYIKVLKTIYCRYGYAIASALHGVQHILRKDFMIQVYFLLFTSMWWSFVISVSIWLILWFFFQPPWDLEVGDKFIIHYTYGCDYAMNVSFIKNLVYYFLLFRGSMSIFIDMLTSDFLQFICSLFTAFMHVFFLEKFFFSPTLPFLSYSRFLLT